MAAGPHGYYSDFHFQIPPLECQHAHISPSSLFLFQQTYLPSSPTTFSPARQNIFRLAYKNCVACVKIRVGCRQSSRHQDYVVPCCKTSCDTFNIIYIFFSCSQHTLVPMALREDKEIQIRFDTYRRLYMCKYFPSNTKKSIVDSASSLKTNMS